MANEGTLSVVVCPVVSWPLLWWPLSSRQTCSRAEVNGCQSKRNMKKRVEKQNRKKKPKYEREKNPPVTCVCVYSFPEREKEIELERAVCFLLYDSCSTTDSASTELEVHV